MASGLHCRARRLAAAQGIRVPSGKRRKERTLSPPSSAPNLQSKQEPKGKAKRGRTPNSSANQRQEEEWGGRSESGALQALGSQHRDWGGGGAEAAVRVVLLALHPPPPTLPSLKVPRHFQTFSKEKIINKKATKEGSEGHCSFSLPDSHREEKNKGKKKKKITKINPYFNPTFSQRSPVPSQSVTHKANPEDALPSRHQEGRRERG